MLVSTPPTSLPLTQASLPWHRNPLHCVRRRLGLLRKLGWSGEGDQPAPNGKRRGMITGDLRETWFGVVDKLRASDGIEVYNPYNALDGALRIR